MKFSTSLAVTDLTISRAGLTLLSGVSLHLKPGEAIILHGPNGVGKTTLLRTLAGQLPFRSGTVEYGSAGEAETETQEGFAAASYCGPENAIKKSVTIDENLHFWRDLYEKTQPSVVDAKARLNLQPYADYPAGALSTGYQKRLGLARLLIADRPVWLIDEPTAALDTVATKDFEAITETHRRNGGSAIIATHDAVALINARFMSIASSEENL